MVRRASTKLPIIITEVAYARAALAAESTGVSLAEFTEAALEVAVSQAMKHRAERQYAQAYQDAIDRGGIIPTRWEFFGEQRMPFVRRPAGVTMNQAGRPSSRHHQNARAAQAGSTARSGTGAAGAKRRGEDPPVDAAEQHGTAWMNEQPPEDRWGPQPDEIPPSPKGKHSSPV